MESEEMINIPSLEMSTPSNLIIGRLLSIQLNIIAYKFTIYSYFCINKLKRRYMKRGCAYRLILLLTLIQVCFTAFAQIAENKFSDRFESAKKLYNSGVYYAAEQAFDALGKDTYNLENLSRSEVEAYKVLCAIALDRVNIDGLVKNFAVYYPNSPELGMVKFALATHYFDKTDYSKALTVYETIHPKHLYK